MLLMVLVLKIRKILETQTDYSEEEKIATENFRMTAGNSKERNWRKFWHKTGFRRFRNKKKKR